MEKVFVSHSHADNRIVATFVQDLWDAGAELWVDMQDIVHGQFQERIDSALQECTWFVLVMTAQSLTSPWVRRETYAADRLVLNKHMRDIIPIVGSPFDEQTIPPMISGYQRYDAVRDGYVAAFQGLLKAVGKPLVVPLSVREIGHEVKGIPEATDEIFQQVRLRTIQIEKVSTIYKIVSVFSDKVLDVQGSAQNDGAAIIQYSYHGGINQQWELIPVDDNFFKIASCLNGKVLDVWNHGLEDGAEIVLHKHLGGSNQHWQLVLVDSTTFTFKIVSQESGKVLDVWNYGGENGAKIVLCRYLGGSNQHWRLISTQI